MANEVISTNFVGTQAAGYISKSTLEAASIAKGYVSIRTNISTPTAVPQVEATEDLLQEYNATFRAQGGFTKTQRMIIPRLLMVNLDWDKKALLKDYESEKMAAGAMNKTFPADFMSYLMERVQSSVSRQIEDNLWRGQYNVASGRVQKFDGLISHLTGAIKPAGAVTFNQANIADAFEAAYLAAPDAVTESPDFRFYVSPKTAKLYKTSLNNYLNLQTTGERPLDWHGIEIVSVPGLAGVENTIIVARTGNLWFATDLLSDASMVKILDMLEQTGDQNIRIRMELFAATQVGYPEEVVVYAPASQTQV